MVALTSASAPCTLYEPKLPSRYTRVGATTPLALTMIRVVNSLTSASSSLMMALPMKSLRYAETQPPSPRLTNAPGSRAGEGQHFLSTERSRGNSPDDARMDKTDQCTATTTTSVTPRSEAGNAITPTTGFQSVLPLHCTRRRIPSIQR
jgi:hypothetical protein